MESFLLSMSWPFLACVALAGLHTHLGLRLFERREVLAGLAMPQAAALGGAFGILLGASASETPWRVGAFSLAFAVALALLLTWLSRGRERREANAILAGTYAFTVAATALAGADLARGDEVRQLLSTSVVWVRADAVLLLAAAFAAVGGLHFVLRARFASAPVQPRKRKGLALPPASWNFFFHASVGFAVTCSVMTVSVLLVVSFLILPPMIGVAFAESPRRRLIVGWGAGVLASLAGLALSYVRHLPSGPAIVASLGLLLAIALAARYLRRAKDRLGASLGLGAGVTLLAALFHWSSGVAGDDRAGRPAEISEVELLSLVEEVRADPRAWKVLAPHVPRLLEEGNEELRWTALDLIEQHEDARLLDAVHARLGDPDDLIREKALECVRAIARRESVDPVLEAATKEPDPFLRVELAETALELGDLRGLALLLDCMDSAEVEQARRDAFERLVARAPLDLPFDATAEGGAHASEIAAFRDWWEAHRDTMTLDERGRVTW